jgi:hypothetical protein
VPELAGLLANVRSAMKLWSSGVAFETVVFLPLGRRDCCVDSDRIEEDDDDCLAKSSARRCNDPLS